MFWRITHKNDDDDHFYAVVEAETDEDANQAFEDEKVEAEPHMEYVCTVPVTMAQFTGQDWMHPSLSIRWEQWEREQAELAAHPSLF
jgi:hypothetical protein